MGTDPGTDTEILAVLGSGAPSYTEGKLLGVPAIDNSTGISHAQALYDLVKTWDLTENNAGIVFDATSSNSGVLRCAAKRLEEMLDKKVFYLVCRHHIIEIIVGSVWDTLFGKVKSPENPFFKKLRDIGSNVSSDDYQCIKASNRWLHGLKDQTEQLLRSILTSVNILRADYREVAELTIIMLGGIPPRGIQWSRLGAIHQARWMAQNLYSMKMFLFADYLKYDEEMKQKLKRMVRFLAFFFTRRWMFASYAAGAPMDDLSFKT